MRPRPEAAEEAGGASPVRARADAQGPAKASLLTHTATYLASNLINAVVPVLLLPVLTRYLLPAEYGQVAMFQTLIAALGGVVGLNVVGAAARKHYDELAPTEQRHYIGACLQILLASAAAVGAVLFVARDPLGTWLGLAPEWVLLAVLASASSMALQLRLTSWLVRKESRSYAAMQILQALLGLVLALGFVVVLRWGAEGRMLAQLATVVGVGVLALALLWRDGEIALGWRPTYLAEALRFGVPLIPHVAGIFLIASADRFVVNSELGSAAAGAYMVAVQLGSAFGLLFDAVNKAYVPWLYERLRRNDAATNVRIVRLTYLWFAAILAMAALGFVLAPWAVRLLAGPEYSVAGDVLGWICLGQCFGGMYLMVTNYVFFSRRTGALSAATLSCGALNILLLVILTRSLGIDGAAIAFATAMGARFLVTWALAQSRHPMPWVRPLSAVAA